ncbi:MAG: DUF4426 domain-containing protein [Pseudomonadales bacterium]|nr:DUF4426 domain-containing protein [Pseudomonadales bacterium]
MKMRLDASNVAIYLATLLCAILLAWPPATQAEQKEIFDGYEVHYNAFNSTFLSPEVAKQYGIIRSKSLALLNVSVLKLPDQSGGTPLPVAASVKGTITNNVQQQREIDFTRITEGQAVYYLGQFQFSENDLLVFNLDATPDGSIRPLKLRFSQSFFAQ